MFLYLLLPLPALLAYLWRPQLTQAGLLWLWAAVSIGLIFLMPIGSRDYTIYLRDFDDINGLTPGELWLQDPLYSAAVWIIGHLGGTAVVFYGFLASVALLAKLTALHRLTRGSSLVTLLYMCSYFFLHEFTQIRAGLAIGIWMHALVELRQSRSRYIALTIIASSIHVQAALGFLPFMLQIFINSRRAARIVCLIAALVITAASTTLFDRWGYTILGAIPDPRTEVYIALAAEDLWVRPNPFSIMSILSFGTAIFGLLAPQQQPPAPTAQNGAVSRSIYLSLLLGSCALSVLSAVSVAAFRVSEHYFSLLPIGVWLVSLGNLNKPRYPALLWIIAILFIYIFLFHSAYLLDPVTGEPNE